MGQAFDAQGNVLGDAYGETKREVFDQLQQRHADAAEFRIRSETAKAHAQIPSIGRSVHYRLSADDATHINRRRTTRESIQQRIHDHWPAGAQAHIGNEVAEGEVYPMVIVRVWGPTAESAVNGQVFLDGNDVLWVISRVVGDTPGTWQWPART